jgi:hypothetical protein
VREGLAFLRASVGGMEGRFLLDTGAAVSVLDVAFAKRAGVIGLRPEMVQAPGGARQGFVAGPASLTVTGGPAARVAPTLLDLAPIARRMGGELSGLIGSDFLAGFVTSIDYRTGDVRLSPGGPGAAGRNAVAMRVGRTPYVTATVTSAGVKRTAEFQIDTGANTPLVFFRPFADKAFPKVQAVPGAKVGVAGVTQTRLGRITALDIAGVRLLDLQADFADDLAPDDASRDYAGVIGGPAWRGRQIILDYPGRRFWIA